MRRIFYKRQTTGRAVLQARGLWFTFRAKPVNLVGAGTHSVYGETFAQAEPHARQEDIRQAWTRYLDRLSSFGINLLRLYPWSFCWDADPPVWACPYARKTEMRYDTARFGDAFFQLLRFICREAFRRDIFVQLVVWDDACLSPGGAAGGPWLRHPWNAACGGPCATPSDFYNLEIAANREMQERFSRYLLAATRDIGTVFYELCSEVGASQPKNDPVVGTWLQQQIAWARQHAPDRLYGVSGSSWSDDGGSAEEWWGQDGIAVLMPQERDGKTALYREHTARHFQFYSRDRISKPRILTDIAFGESDGDKPLRGAIFEDERKHFWVAFANGGHAHRSSWQGFAPTPTWESCRVLGAFVRDSGLVWWDMEPIEHVVDETLCRAYVLGNTARGEYFVYFLERPAAPLSLQLPETEPLNCTWIDTRTGEQTAGDPYTPGAVLPFAPGTQDRGLWLRRAASEPMP